MFSPCAPFASVRLGVIRCQSVNVRNPSAAFVAHNRRPAFAAVHLQPRLDMGRFAACWFLESWFHFLFIPWVSARFRRAKTARLAHCRLPLVSSPFLWEQPRTLEHVACVTASTLCQTLDGEITRHITRPLAITTPAFALWVAPACALGQVRRVLVIPLMHLAKLMGEKKSPPD